MRTGPITGSSTVSMSPRLGAHNEEVYCGLLGLTTEELEELRREDVI